MEGTGKFVPLQHSLVHNSYQARPRMCGLSEEGKNLQLWHDELDVRRSSTRSPAYRTSVSRIFGHDARSPNTGWSQAYSYMLGFTSQAYETIQ